jgi:outer membrane receptor protein involved in Fe transport
MRMTHLLRVAGTILLTVLCFAAVAQGQSETATVSGLVTDTTGGTVPQAEVHLQSVDRGTVETTMSNNAGIYVFPSVQPGQYQVTVRKPGFKQVDLLGVIVNTQDHIEQNIRLQLGSVSESITVTADTTNMNMTDGAVSTVVDRQFAENLPLNGRSFQTLIQLTPGVVLTPSTASDGGQFSVNGQRAASNYWMVDGVSANIGIGVFQPLSPSNGLSGSVGSFSALGGTNSLVSVDALQEFRIQTSTYAPEFGRTPGGQISIVTRSGTNQFHGTAFDYLRNGVLDANDWFADNLGLPRPEESQNDFGGTFSGPIVKDKTFFFFSYEGLRLRLPETTLTTVPDLSARENAIPALQPYLNAFPLPNGTDNVATGIAQFNASFVNPATLDAYSLRVDHKLSNNWSLFGRYDYSPSEIDQRGSGTLALSIVSPTRITTQTGTVGATWLISPTITNDLRFNYSRTSASGSSYLDTFGGAVPLSPLPFPSPITPQNGLFSFRVISLTQDQLNVGQNERNVQRQINLVDSVSISKGAHSLKFGVDFRRLSPSFAPQAYSQAADFLDVPSTENGNPLLAIIESNVSATLLFRNLGVYGQDTWRIAPRLTLTYGLRWDVDFVPSSLSGPNLAAVTGFNLNSPSNLALAPSGTLPYKTTYGNVAPRLGLAYQLRQSQEWQTVVRGGFGVFYDLASSEVGNEIFGAVYPFGCLALKFGVTFPLSPAATAPPSITPSCLTNGTLAAFDPNLKLPYALEWNFAFEQALGKQQTISASYIGAAGRRLLQTAVVIAPNPNFGSAALVTNSATSDYNALQIQFQRRLSRGLQALASYSWAHSIDDGSAGSVGNVTNALVSPTNPSANRGSSDFDIRNAFSAGVTYEIPALKDSTPGTAILRGWSLENIIQARSAPPINIYDAGLFEFNSGFDGNIRPDVVPGEPLYLFGSQYPGGKALNPAAFTNPPLDPTTGNPLRQGDLPRNVLRGFGAAQWDLAVHRDFPIHESTRLQFRAEMFNVLNHPNFGPPNGQFGTGGFGLSNQTLAQSLSGGAGFGSNLGGGAFSPLYQFGGPRSIQLALRLFF